MRPLKNKSHQVMESIRAKVRLIQCVLDNPEAFANNKSIKTSLKSQGALAQLTYTFEADNREWTSTSISLTTLKSKIYPSTQDVSFENLNRMRIGAYEKLDETERIATATDKDTKTGFREKIASLEKSLELQRENNFHLLQALLFSKSSLESIGNLKNEKAREKRVREAGQTIANILSLNTYPFNQLQQLTEHMKNHLKVVK
jgi:hypothetical protein